MYYYLNLKMNKGVGYMPTQEDIKSLPAEKQNIDYIKSCMVFNLNNDNDLLPIEEFKIVADGLDNLSLNDGLIQQDQTFHQKTAHPSIAIQALVRAHVLTRRAGVAHQTIRVGSMTSGDAVQACPLRPARLHSGCVLACG